MKITLLLLTLFIPFFLLAQNSAYPDKEYDKTIGGARADYFYDMIENYEGNIVLIGTSKSEIDKEKKNKSEDILFVEASPEGNLVKKTAFGTRGKEGGNAIVQTFDGGYMIAGYIQEKSKKNPFLLKIDHEKNIEESIHTPIEEDGEWKDIIQLDNANILSVGTINGKAVMMKTNIYLSQSKIIYLGINGQINTIKKAKNGIIIGGVRENKNKIHPFFARINPSGNVVGGISDYNNDPRFSFGQVMDIWENENGYSLLCQSSPRKSKLLLLLDISKNGDIKSVKLKGDHGETESESIVKTYGGKTYIVGGSQSHSKEGVKLDGFIYDTSVETEKWRNTPVFYGNNLNDKLYTIFQSSDGSIYSSGYTNTKLDKEGWLFKYPSETIPNTTGRAQIDISQLKLEDNTNDTYIQPEENGFISFFIENKGTNAAYNIRTKITLESSNFGLEFFTKVVIGYLPVGKKKKISIPVFSSGSLRQGNTTLNISFTEGNNTNIPSKKVTIKSILEPKPELEIIAHEYFPRKPKRGEKVTFTAIIKNTGNKEANNVLCDFYFNGNSITPIDTKQKKIGILSSNTEKKISFEFRVEKPFQGQEVNAGVKYYSTETNWEEESIPLLLTPDIEPKVLPEIILSWLEPTNEFSHEYKTKAKEINTKVSVITTFKNIPKEHYTLYIDGVAQKGGRYDEGSIQTPKRVDGNNNSFHFHYVQRGIILPEKRIYKLQIKVKHEGVLAETPVLKVIREEEGRDLHIISIGINNYSSHNTRNLEYAAKDARDFSEAFELQEGILYNEVHQYLICTDCKDTLTTKSHIESTLGYVFSNEKSPVKKNDIIIVFIASHGFTKDQKLYLKPGDYKKEYINEQYTNKVATAISFEEEIMLLIQQRKLKNHVFIFIDACKSGAAIKEVYVDGGSRSDVDPNSISEVIRNWTRLDKKVRVFTSSGSNELSWESEEEENGLFTQAMLDAFTGVANVYEKKKNIIDFKEFYSFVKNRTKDLAWKHFRKNQTPQMEKEDYMKDPIDFFIVPKK